MLLFHALRIMFTLALAQLFAFTVMLPHGFAAFFGGHVAHFFPALLHVFTMLRRVHLTQLLSILLHLLILAVFLLALACPRLTGMHIGGKDGGDQYGQDGE